MKIVHITLSILLLACTAAAQKTEIETGLIGNLSFFRGTGAADITRIYISDVPGAIPNASADYYGKDAKRGWGAYVAIQRVNKQQFLAGISAAYEELNSSIRITEVTSRTSTPADGTTRMKHTYATFFPYVGKRFGSKLYAFDVNAGLDVALPLTAHEKAEAVTSSGTITTNVKHDKPAVDLRPRIQVKMQYNHIGLLLSYAVGLTNYSKAMGMSTESYINVAQLGFFYRL